MQQASLFQNPVPKWESFSIPDGELYLCQTWLSAEEALILFDRLRGSLEWEQSVIHIHGKNLPIPRLNAWYGDPGRDYTYSSIRLSALPWTPLLTELRDRLSKALGLRFNSVLANLYRDGRDSVSWHADDEPELGRNPVIASISLGSERRFVLKHRHNPDFGKVELSLGSGSLLVMRGSTQHHWLHQVPKTRLPVGPRINLTYRQIQPGV